jgi:tRNA/rRNA methyltransferase
LPESSGTRFAATRFVLVEPSHPGNVGAAARAIKTMGFGRLVLVNPRTPLVVHDAVAVAMASGAQDVLAAALVVPTLDAALAGTHWSLALSARAREYGPPLAAPRAAALQARGRAAGGEVALVFGNERVGLSNDDVERCTMLAHIPASPGYSSLNLAQAVQVLAYELRLAYLDDAPVAAGGDLDTGYPDSQAGAPAAEATGSGRDAGRPMAGARSEEIEGMFAHLQTALVAIGFLDPDNPKRLFSRLRRLFGRTGLEREEVNIVRGIAKHILLHARVDARPERTDAASDPLPDKTGEG